MRSTLLCLVALGASAAPAFAETMSQPRAVVELFTSQGCSSCPRANDFIAELDRTHADVLALSYGVTYWDYLGWPDTFGHTAFTDRQKNYDAVFESGVYTPMMVVAGQAHASKLTPQMILAADVPQQLRFTRKMGELCLDGELPGGAKLAVVEYKPGTHTVDVKRGENKGRTLTLANVVTHVAYRDWDGEMICGFYPKAGLAVLAHDAGTSAVIAAARVEP